MKNVFLTSVMALFCLINFVNCSDNKYQHQIPEIKRYIRLQYCVCTLCEENDLASRQNNDKESARRRNSFAFNQCSRQR